MTPPGGDHSTWLETSVSLHKLKISPKDVLCESYLDVDLQFTEKDFQESEVLLLQMQCGDSILESTMMKPKSAVQISQKDKEKLAQSFEQRILTFERQMSDDKKRSEEIFEEDTENLHGELEKDLKKFEGQPKLFELLLKYKEVFGPLPPPGEGCPLAIMDLELKDEFKHKTLRQKCWPMPKEDCLEIEKQVNELVEAGLVEPFPIGKFPQHCSPTFLVDKKESKTRRMVGQYAKLNKHTKPHAGFLPNMEEMVENLAKSRFKYKLD